MKRSTAIKLLVVLIIAGSLVSYYAGNFIFADVANYTYGWNGLNILASIPGFMFVLELIAATMLVIRYFIREKYRKRTLMLYIRIIMGFSIIGVIGVILAGIYSYGSFTKHYPFPYYLIVCLIVHVGLIIYLAITYNKVKKNMKEDVIKKNIKVSYVIYSTLLSAYLFLAYDRFGAFLLSFNYIQLSTLYMTWYVYIWLTLPLLLFVFVVCKDFGFYEDYDTQIIHLSLILILHLVFTYGIYATGTHNSLFISATSPAFGLDRLATNPYTIYAQTAIVFLAVLYYLIRCIYFKVTGKKYENIYSKLEK